MGEDSYKRYNLLANVSSQVNKWLLKFDFNTNMPRFQPGCADRDGGAGQKVHLVTVYKFWRQCLCITWTAPITIADTANAGGGKNQNRR